MDLLDTKSQYVPFLDHQYVPLHEEDFASQTTLEESMKSFISRTGIFSRNWLGFVCCFVLGVFTGVSLLFWLPQKHALVTTLGVPRSVTEAVTYSTFKPDHRFDLNRQDNESAAAWKTLDSRFIWIDYPMQKGLKPSWPEGADRQTYSIAAFHQLHCTYVMYLAWNSLVEHGPSILDDEYPGRRGHYAIGGHFGHCLEIVRQALMCYADATLEPMLEPDGETISQVGEASGWGTLHTCRDFDKLVEWLDAHEEGMIDSADLPP